MSGPISENWDAVIPRMPWDYRRWWSDHFREIRDLDDGPPYFPPCRIHGDRCASEAESAAVRCYQIDPRTGGPLQYRLAPLPDYPGDDE